MKAYIFNKKIWIVSYILLLIISFFYVHWAINQDRIHVLTKKNNDNEDIIEEHFVRALVKLESPAGYREYSVTKKDELKNVDTVEDLLKKLWESQNFYFEKNSYVYGNGIDNVNYIAAPLGYTWRIFLFDKDVTANFGHTNLMDDAVVTLKLVTADSQE